MSSWDGLPPGFRWNCGAMARCWSRRRTNFDGQWPTGRCCAEAGTARSGPVRNTSIFRAGEYLKSREASLFYDDIAIRSAVSGWRVRELPRAAAAGGARLFDVPRFYGSALAGKVIATCREIMRPSSEQAGRTTRIVFYHRLMRDVHRVLGEWIAARGMRTWIDAAGNLRGIRTGYGPRLAIGSHLDTVPNAGAFDGILGVAWESRWWSQWTAFPSK